MDREYGFLPDVEFQLAKEDHHSQRLQRKAHDRSKTEMAFSKEVALRGFKPSLLRRGAFREARGEHRKSMMLSAARSARAATAPPVNTKEMKAAQAWWGQVGKAPLLSPERIHAMCAAHKRSGKLPKLREVRELLPHIASMPDECFTSAKDKSSFIAHMRRMVDEFEARHETRARTAHTPLVEEPTLILEDYVYVKCLTKTISIAFDAHTTVHHLMVDILKSERIPIASQILIYRGKTLHPDDLLAAIGIANGSTLELRSRLNGGGKHRTQAQAKAAAQRRAQDQRTHEEKPDQRAALEAAMRANGVPAGQAAAAATDIVAMGLADVSIAAQMGPAAAGSSSDPAFDEAPSAPPLALAPDPVAALGGKSPQVGVVTIAPTTAPTSSAPPAKPDEKSYLGKCFGCGNRGHRYNTCPSPTKVEFAKKHHPGFNPAIEFGMAHAYPGSGPSGKEIGPPSKNSAAPAIELHDPMPPTPEEDRQQTIDRIATNPTLFGITPSDEVLYSMFGRDAEIHHDTTVLNTQPEDDRLVIDRGVDRVEQHITVGRIRANYVTTTFESAFRVAWICFLAASALLGIGFSIAVGVLLYMNEDLALILSYVLFATSCISSSLYLRNRFRAFTKALWAFVSLVLTTLTLMCIVASVSCFMYYGWYQKYNLFVNKTQTLAPQWRGPVLPEISLPLGYPLPTPKVEIVEDRFEMVPLPWVMPLIAYVGSVVFALLDYVVFYYTFTFHRRVIYYSPHHVSCVLAEYPRGADPEVARATIRTKLLRLAALPVPDHIAVEILDGSEQVSLAILSQQHFLSRLPAAILQAADWRGD